MKVICAGAPKTGTKSIARALRILGYDAVYDIEEAMEFAFEEWEDVWEGRKSDLSEIMTKVYSKGVEAIVDMPHSHFFDHFLEEWPKAKVILTIRDTEEWFESYKTMVQRAEKDYGPLRIFYYLSPSSRRLIKWCEYLSTVTSGCVKPKPFFWKTWFVRHNNFVRTSVPSSQLLEFDVKEGWKPLCKFLDKPVPDQPFPCENQAGCKRNIADRMLQDTWIAKKMLREIQCCIIAVFLLIFTSLFYMFYY
ncbi:uncharacterized protein LOC143458956 [Clavelina lepadiformis]|uniref:uncharacterized protein LOC143458956 n=1 Tax=Clavelina lepadiformis TaxID=159417 RepID=UPI0040429CB3